MGVRRPRLGMAGRVPMRSPGRPPVARREHRQRFWKAIAHGLSSEDAAVVCGVSPAVGARWFRQGGGMPSTSLAPLSGRYLSFTEREEITVLTAQGYGVREIARRVGRSASTISREVRRNAATRGGRLEYRATTAQWHADRRATAPEGGQARRQPRAPGVRAGPTCRQGHRARRHGGARSRGSQRSDAVTGAAKDRRWARSWSPEQIANRLRVALLH
jgi:transposase